MKTPLVEIPISTSDGQFIARYSRNGLAELYFPKSAALSERAPAAHNGDTDKHAMIQILRWHKLTTAALKRILSGKEPPEFPPLDIIGTTFQKKVWKVMRKIPLGKTLSYGEVAKAAGKPKAVRAVGSVCGSNSIPVLIPCHRVLAAHGKIGGFGSGLHWKRTLLSREGVEFNGDSKLGA